MSGQASVINKVARPAGAPVPRTHPNVALALLTLVLILNAVDRQIVAVLAEPIKTDLQLSDSELGLLSGFVFAVFYTFFGIPIAWISDRVNRVNLVSAACALWSIFSGLSGLATNFLGLALARVGVAVGEAGGSPPSYSIISDYFPPERRGTALAIFSIGIPIGMSLAIAYGGWAGANFGWRTAFFTIALPGVVASLLLLLFVEEPRRGRLDPVGVSDDPPPPLWGTISSFIRNPALLWITIGASLSVFASHGVTAWMPAFLIRTKEMSLTEMAGYYSVISGAGMILGSLIAGRLADMLLKRSKHLVPLIPAATNLVTFPFVMLAVWSPSWPIALACLVVPMIGFWTYLPVALVLIQNTVPANQRATCGSLLLFSVGIIGIGGGGTYIGVISDLAVAQWGDQSLNIAFVALLPAFLMATAAFFTASRMIRKQEAEAAK